MPRPIRVAAIGIGFFSQFHLQGWSDIEDADLVALSSRDPDALNRAADTYGVAGRYGDLETMLDREKPDLLDIISPPSTHAAFIRAAFDRDIAVICQKPFTTSLAEAEEMAALSEVRQLPLLVHENFRFQPWYREIKNRLDAGELGDLYQITFRLRPGDGQGPGAYLDRQPYFQQMERFLVHETAIHQIDVFRYLFGEIDGVTARLAKINPVIAGEDAGLIIFEFANGCRGLFDGNRLSDHIADNRRLTMGEVIIEGAKGTLRLDGNACLYMRKHGENSERQIAYPWRDRGFGGDCVYLYEKHVIAHLQNAAPVMNTARAYLKNLAIEEAVYQSQAENRHIRLRAGSIT
ncbi:MAG: Gfo/Idh/MocA family oxidoreductase [Rhodospirillales bacterium]|nr:Gfo/Idh/MocA family oxidoreductase [Rhodospirillales bacterium]